MKRFQKDCIGDIVSIADLTLSPAGGLAAFVTHRPNVEKDGYDCFLHTLNTQTGEIEQLTFTGSESSFCFIDGGDALLFPGLREQKDRDRVQNGEELTAFYRLPLAGGGQPSGRSASNSARCLTPMVSLRPQAGQRPSRRIVSEGSRQTAQARCPSR